MKKIFTLLLLLTILLTTSCIKRDSMENIDIYTSVYPIEYITNWLYGDKSNIYSIYPNGVIVEQYKLTEKQIEDYSKANLFVFNGLGYDKEYVIPMFKYNKNLKIIDTAYTMEYTYGVEELWLNPLNFLMMAQNIKNGLNEYINNHYIKEEIKEKYENLKIEISGLDAKIKLISESAKNKKIVASSDLFKYLKRYNLEVYSLEENENLTEKTIDTVKNLIKNGEVNYIFIKKHEDINDTIKKIIEETNVETLEFHTLSNLTESERNDKKDYISIMYENIELLKKELYD